MDSVLYEVWQGIRTDFADLPSVREGTQLLLRLALAAFLGGVVGFQRERVGRAAGLRTHMLVALGSAFFLVVPVQAGMPLGDISRVLQGLMAGIGFLGAGTIMKRQGHIEGLTTAASLWLTAAVGVAAGLGRETSAVLATIFALIVLGIIPLMVAKGPQHDDGPEDGTELPTR
ncbi:MAG: MgtC/SapB family protein [Candidatus Tectimicrobiota bacterium]